MEQLVPNRPDLGLFDDPARVRDGEGLARRQAYVAMTRTTGRLYCLYRHASHPLVAAMLRHVRRVTEEVAW
jgi:hypothetical protein